MTFKILSPEESKKRARANVAEWERQKGIEEKRKALEPKNEIKTEENAAQEPRVEKKRKPKRSAEEQKKLNGELFEASKHNDTDKIKKLLKEGAKVNGRDEKGWSALKFAVTNGYLASAEILIEKGANVNAKDENNGYILDSAVRGCHAEITQLLIKNGVNLEKKNRYSGETVLIETAKAGRFDFIEVLISGGANINARDKNGKTALTLTIETSRDNISGNWSHHKVIDILKKHGATE